MPRFLLTAAIAFGAVVVPAAAWGQLGGGLLWTLSTVMPYWAPGALLLLAGLLWLAAAAWLIARVWRRPTAPPRRRP